MKVSLFKSAAFAAILLIGFSSCKADADERRVLKIRAFRQESVGHSTSAEGSSPPHSATG